jgi:hypothetical protein
MDHDDLTDRLRALGEQPVPEATRHQHLTRMTATTPSAAPRRFGHLAVAAAAIVGFFAGSTGLAMAGALPGPAQGVAHDVLSTISVQVPDGTPGHRGSCVSAAAKIADPEDKATAKAACPKGGPPAAGEAPGRSGEAPGRTKADKHADDPCRGKPPWAGRNDMTEAEKQAAKERRAAQCGRTLDADDAGDAAEDAAEREREAAEEQQEAAEEQQPAPAPQQDAPPVEPAPQPDPPAEPQPDLEPEAIEPAPEPPADPEG